MTDPHLPLDALDVDLIAALEAHPRAPVLELSRILRVARGTVQARLQRLEEAGVITGYGPDVDVAAAGYPVLAFVTLEIAQGRLPELAAELEAIPGVLEAHATTGTGDVLCRVAARSHQDLQATLLQVDRSPSVVRSTSVIALVERTPPPPPAAAGRPAPQRPRARPGVPPALIRPAAARSGTARSCRDGVSPRPKGRGRLWKAIRNPRTSR